MNQPAPRFLPWACFNGTTVAAADLKISALGDGFMFGQGLFETIKVARGAPVVLEDHVARLSRSAGALGLGFDNNLERVRAACGKVIEKNRLAEGNLKWILFQGENGAEEIIVARESVYSKDTYSRGFRLTIETVAGRPALAGYKTLNYFENIAAKRRAVAKGFDEAIFADSAGEVFEGATTNLFVAKGGRVSTPPDDGRILPGIARGRVLRFFGSRVLQRPISWAQLREADEVFVTNALLGVMPVAEVDGMRYDLTQNAITKEAMAALNL